MWKVVISLIDWTGEQGVWVQMWEWVWKQESQIPSLSSSYWLAPVVENNTVRVKKR